MYHISYTWVLKQSLYSKSRNAPDGPCYPACRRWSAVRLPMESNSDNCWTVSLITILFFFTSHYPIDESWSNNLRLITVRFWHFIIWLTYHQLWITIFKRFFFIAQKISALMKIYFIRKQKTSSDIKGFIKLHFDLTQEHSALFLQKCTTLLNRAHASCSVTTSDFLSWRRNVLHML